MRILLLSPEVANQIAAGEVIERPASVLKELLENALDAEADYIHVEIGYGGLNQIKVSDNGQGIMAEDLPLALMAHATSKIKSIKDLEAIESLGFRGEALASIASVARVSISSRPASQESGMLVSEKNGENCLQPVARSRGTTVEVKDIFYNAPVRKKFLKSERAEFLAIDSLVRRFALGAPFIAIDLSHNGKLQLQLPKALHGSSRIARMKKIFGKSFMDEAIPVDTTLDGMHLTGWISGANHHRSQNDKIWFYINGRMVRDKLLHHAIKQAYEKVLPPGRYPACLLYLTIAPELVDVNVHPTKHEVRFQDARLVHDFVSVRLSQLLGNVDPLQVSVQALPYSVLTPKVQSTYADRASVGYDKKYDWIGLNQKFALTFLANKPYLIELNALQKAFILDGLTKASLPLVKRPVLVPIVILWENSRAELDSVKPLLSQLGIEVSLEGQQVTVRTLPISLPHLDIHAFFNAIFHLAKPSIEILFPLLAENHTFVSGVSEEKQEAYRSYLESLLLDKTMQPSFMMHFSLENCQDFFNAS